MDDDDFEIVEAPKLVWIVGIAIGVSTFIITAYLSGGSRPFFSFLSIGIGILLTLVLWGLIAENFTKIYIFLVTVIHLVTAETIPLPHRISYGYVFTPFLAFDAYIFYRLFLVLRSHLRRN